MGRKLAIGDIHGGLRGLVQLLERIDLTPEDQLIFLGDYVDGWSDSANTVTYLIELAKQNSCIFIRGNHDDLAHRWLETGELNQKWLEHGGQSSIDAYRNFSEDEIKAHLKFFSEMFNYYKDDQERLFVHAGFTNLHGPDFEYHETGFYWDRTLWEMALSLNENLQPDHQFYPKRLQHFEEIFIGHTPVTRIGETTPVHKANIWNVDTGAAFKGPVSAIDVNTKEIYQSDPVHELYPGESGRN
ncbi:metallophosphoesterase family protein [Christiangramia flava]|uniref:Serine/threonine protein phosphatase n=1 Tax=Christiangramia flava JLT2011 TaxID=1229726 RepID=A0A1L7I3P4_9FLAO|nr:metallophosphoesterase family protein [Christiangramia flava]APU68239.1 Serine/threonine protein phosphatase [Christiangramia flava JLT2011]OSS40974.1 Serine/threonine protein phosphatase [Christiangramia flava JLT2011]